MSMISGELLEQVAGYVGGSGGLSAAELVDTTGLRAKLRLQYPGVHFTVCSDDDIPPQLAPAFENATVRLYYVDANEHCVKLTSDAEAASGIVVAFHDGD
jgi:hypothetical protein